MARNQTSVAMQAPKDGDVTPEPAARPLVLIDPAPLTRQALSEMLTRGLPDFVIVAAPTGDELTHTIGQQPAPPALIIVYIKNAELTERWVQTTLEQLRFHLADVRVVLLSDRDTADQVINALASGVRGFITTSMQAEVAFAALRLVCAGGTFIPAHIFAEPNGNPNNGSNHEQKTLAPRFDLSPREFSIMELLCEGRSNKVIATRLRLQESTVKVHVRNIMRKLHVTNRTHAAAVANRLLSEPPTPELQ